MFSSRILMVALTSIALSPVVCSANLAVISGSYDGATHGTYEQFTSTTPFYLSDPSVLSDITVTGTVDVSGLTSGGSVLYVGLYQPDLSSTVILEPRAHAGFFGNVTGGIGQGDATNPGENVQTSGIPLLSSLTTVSMTFDAVSAGSPTSFSSTFASTSGPDTRTINYNAGAFAGQIDFSEPVYPYVMAFASDGTQSATFDVTFSQLTVVPEASSFLCMACVTGLGLMRSRSRRRQA